MPALPWAKWYPTNWAAEPGLRLCEAATRGIWFEAINTMMLQETDHVTGTVEQLAALCICRIPQMQLAINQLKTFKVAEVVMQKGCITLTNRKRARDFNTKDLRRQAANARWCKPDANAMQTPPRTDHANTYAPSASAYASASKGKGCGGNPPFEEIERRLGRLFNRDSGDVLTYAEQSALAEISRRPNALAEVAEIESFHQKEKKFFPRSLSVLANDWQKFLDHARNWKPDPTSLSEEKKLNAELKKAGIL